ncbi:hypothetical protein WJX74_007654 [Apatococcus lobatus]|uniref:Uncharacterized protein n=1 Tax=Apatococcus lobatus TaxID=904363 RepID=A0AAW1SAQ4_9CHLO
MSTSKHSWYSDCQPGLLSNRVLRRFLSRFSEAAWPEVVKLTAVYGALRLEQVQGTAYFAVEDIKAAIDRLSIQKAVQDSVPGLQAQVHALSASLAEIGSSLPAQPAACDPGGAAAAGGPASLNEAAIPSHEAIYPDWWGDSAAFSDQTGAGRPQPAGQRRAVTGSRTQPRLAYSVLQEQEPPLLHHDDLVTAQYIQVPSSGYGQNAAAATKAHQGLRDPLQQLKQSQEPKVAQAVPSSQVHASRQTKCLPGAEPGLPLKPGRPAAARTGSCIAAEVQATRQRLKLQHAAKNRRTAVALNQGRLPTAAPESDSLQTAQFVEQLKQRPTAVAERLLTSPWMADFLSPSKCLPSLTPRYSVENNLQEQAIATAACQDAEPCSLQRAHCDVACHTKEPALGDLPQAAARDQEQLLQQPSNRQQGVSSAGSI